MISVAAKKHCDVRLMLNFFPYMESRLVRLTSACWSRRQEALAAVRYIIFIFVKIHSLWKHEGAAERNRRSPGLGELRRLPTRSVSLASETDPVVQS